MASRAERTDLPQALKEGLKEFHESEARQLELATVMLRDSVEDLLGVRKQNRTLSTVVSSDNHYYEIYLQRTGLEGAGNVEFVIKPNAPTWASEDSLFTLCPDNYVLDMKGDEVYELEQIAHYIDAVEFLRNKLYPLP